MRQRLRPQLNFQALLGRIAPSESESSGLRGHQSTIQRRLTNSLNIANFRRIGSTARGTAIRGHSDLDLMAIFPASELVRGDGFISSNTALTRVRTSLQARYPSTDIRRDGVAVVLSFGAGQRSLDVVPAKFAGVYMSSPMYDIPSGDGGWRRVSPAAHNLFITRANTRAGMKLTRVAQLLRWWKYSRIIPIPISSFFMDLTLAESRICEGALSYPYCLARYFAHLDQRGCRGFQDPCAVSNSLDAASTTPQLEAVRTAVAYASHHAEQALAAAKREHFQEANRQWSLVFNDYY